MDTMSWGHIATHDLGAGWVDLGDALAPHEWYNAHGVWDGSVTVIDGVPRLVYSCLQVGRVNDVICVGVAPTSPPPAQISWVQSVP